MSTIDVWLIGIIGLALITVLFFRAINGKSFSYFAVMTALMIDGAWNVCTNSFGSIQFILGAIVWASACAAMGMMAGRAS